MNFRCAKFYTKASKNVDTIKIFQFLAIFEQNFTVLPQNNKFWTYSAWHHNLYLKLCQELPLCQISCFYQKVNDDYNNPLDYGAMEHLWL